MHYKATNQKDPILAQVKCKDIFLFISLNDPEVLLTWSVTVRKLFLDIISTKKSSGTSRNWKWRTPSKKRIPVLQLLYILNLLTVKRCWLKVQRIAQRQWGQCMIANEQPQNNINTFHYRFRVDIHAMKPWRKIIPAKKLYQWNNIISLHSAFVWTSTSEYSLTLTEVCFKIRTGSATASSRIVWCKCI